MDHDAALRTPTRGPDEDTTLGDTSAHSLFQNGDDSLFGDVLRPGAARSDVPTEETESAEQVQRQLEQLEQLNRIFSSYEAALAGGVAQIETFAQKVHETDALLDTYIDLLKHAQARRDLLSDPSWPGATKDAADRAERQRTAQREAAEAALRASQRPRSGASVRGRTTQARSAQPEHPVRGARGAARGARGRGGAAGGRGAFR